MTAKKTTKTKATTKSAKKATAKPAPETKVVTTDECAKGGPHEWTTEGDERFCAKCKEPAPAKASKKKANAKTKSGDKKLSAIDAAATVLASANAPLNAKEMIDAMATKRLWTSPGGQPPHATLYSAILREITLKGKDARFTKTERGKFAAITK